MRAKHPLLLFTGVVLFLGCNPAASAQTTGLNIFSTTASPGATVSMGMNLTVSGTAPVSIEWVINYSATALSSVTITPGPVATSTGKTLSCSSGVGSLICILEGTNTTALSSGTVAYISATLAANAATNTLQLPGVVGSDANGNSLGISPSGGTIAVQPPPVLSGITCSPTNLNGGSTTNCTVTLSQAASAGGASVTLASNNALLTVPTTVSVAAGATTATFSATAAATIASNQTAAVTASYNSSTQAASVNLQAPVLVSGVVCSPTSLGQSALAICAVTTTQPALTGGASVTLSSNNTLLTVPTTATVAAGATTATFSAAAAATIASNQTATVTASYNSSTQTASVNLQAPVLVSGVVCSPTSLGQSALATCTVTTTQPALTGGASVTLASNNTLLTVPATVTVAAGATTATFSATAAATIASNQTATVTASYNSSTQTVSVNLQAPVLVSGVVCSPASLGQSAVATCTVTTTQTAPTGGASVTLSSDNPLLTVPTIVTVTAGATTATFGATAAATIASNQTSTVTATLGTSSQTSAINLQAPVLVSGVVCSPTSLVQSAVATCTVTLTQTALTGGASVTLSSNNTLLTVPTTVTVAAGATTATFSATAAASIASSQTATVTASYNSSTQTASVNLQAPVFVSGVLCSPTSLGQSAASTCTVTTTQPALTGGASVTLSSGNTLLTVPATVNVTAGATTAMFSATAAATIVSNQTATVTASYNSSTQTASVNLLAPVLVSGLVCSPTSMGQSAVVTCTVTLTQTAMTGGASVTLSSNNTLLTMPATVTVAAGATTATFSATAAASIPSNQSATVTATLGTSSQTATINLQAPVLVSGVVCSPTSLGQSAVSTCTLTLTQPALTGGASVMMSSNNPLLTVPTSVTVAAGVTTATFNATAAAMIVSNQTATVTASYTSSTQTASVNLQAPVFMSGVVCSPTSLGQSTVSTCTVTLTQTAMTGGASVTLSSNNTLLTVPTTVTVAAGATTATFSATAAASIPSIQSATVTATLGTSSQTSAINLQAPVLVSGVVCSPTSLGQSAVSTCTVTTTQPAPTGGASVTLSSNNTLLTVPTSVSVAAGTTTATFGATAAATIASNQTAMVTASYNSSTQTASVNLQAPLLVSGVVCSPTSLGQSAVSTCTVTLTQSALTGGASATLSSNNTLLTVPATVTVAAGATTATFSATAATTIVSSQTATVTASYNSSTQTASMNLQAPVLVSGVVCSPTSLGQSAVSTCTVTTTQTAPTGGSSVTLSSNNTLLTVPATVTVAPGATTATFGATASASIASNQMATVTAAVGTGVQTAMVSLQAPALKVTCATTSLGQNAKSACTITLTQSAPKGGSTVTLSSNNALLTVPTSVKVSAGSTVVTFTAATAPSFATNQSATMTATLDGVAETVTFNLTAPLLVSGLVCDPVSLRPGATGACTVSLNQPAPANGASVKLASSSKLLAVPASVSITAGASAASFSALAGGEVTFVSGQFVSPGSITCDLTCTAKLPANVTNGNIVAFSASWQSGSTVIKSVSASNGTCALLSATKAVDATNGWSTESGYCLPNSTAAYTITFHMSAETVNFHAMAAEYTGQNASSPIDFSAAQAGVNCGGTSCNTPAVATAVAADLVISVMSRYSGNAVSISAGSGTFRGGTANFSGWQDQIQGSAASAAPAFTTSAAAGASAITTIAVHPVAFPAKSVTITATLGVSSETTEINLLASTAQESPIKSPESSVTGQNPAVQPAVTVAAQRIQASSASLTEGVSLQCSPSVIAAGSPVSCQLNVDSPASQAVSVTLTSSTASVRVPATVTTRPNQSSLTFQAQSDSASKQQQVAITAALGTSVAENTILVMASSSPVISAPRKQFVRTGASLSFRVSATDASELALNIQSGGLPVGAAFDPGTGVVTWSPQISQQGRYYFLFTATNSAGQSSTTQVEVEVDPGVPVVNTPAQSCSPNAIGVIHGKWLASTGPGVSDTSGSAFNLGGTKVLIDGHSVPVLRASFGTVDFLCPAAAPGNPHTVTVDSEFGSSQPVTIKFGDANPTILSLDDSEQGLISFSGTDELVMERSFTAPSRPAQPGDQIIIYATGLGSGETSNSGAMTVQFGSVSAAIEAVSPVPGRPGLFSVQVQTPPAIPSGVVPVRLQITAVGGQLVSSNAVSATFEPVSQ